MARFLRENTSCSETASGSTPTGMKIAGDSVRIFSNGGVTEMAASAVAGFEQDEAPRGDVPRRLRSPQLPAPIRQCRIPPPATPADLAAMAAKKVLAPGSVRQERHEGRIRFPARRGIAQRRDRPDATDAGNRPRTGRRSRGTRTRTPRAERNICATFSRSMRAAPIRCCWRWRRITPDRPLSNVITAFRLIRETREYILRVLKNWAPEGTK